MFIFKDIYLYIYVKLYENMSCNKNIFILQNIYKNIYRALNQVYCIYYFIKRNWH